MNATSRKPEFLSLHILIFGLACFGTPSFATEYYVATTGTNTNSGLSWNEAKQTIQAALDLAIDGDAITVTNGVYATGGSGAFGSPLTSRAAITNAVTVSSVNGPAHTTIEGAGPAGPTAVRCAFVGANATLSGFTLANGAALASVGSIFEERSAGGAYCVDSSSVVSNCVLIGNTGVTGGAAVGGTFINCTFINNHASNWGGATRGSDLNNCLLFGNSAGLQGGAAYQGTLNNCTIADNSAVNEGGGVYANELNNCIVYFNKVNGSLNHPTANYATNSVFRYTCTTPLPDSGTGNISTPPLFVDATTDNYRLSEMSPCIAAGNNFLVANPTALDGVPRIVQGTVDMGAYEWPLVDITVVAVNGSATGSGLYAAGSELRISASPPTIHHLFLGWNDGNTNPSRIITVPSSSTPYTGTFFELPFPLTAYVDPANPNPVWPYDTWESAGTNLQHVIDATLDGDTVLVADGTFATGSRAVASAVLQNRVVIDRAITVQSANGPAATIIEGAGPRGPNAIRCVHLGAGATLRGFTLLGGATRSAEPSTAVNTSGGGVFCITASSTISNCVFTANAAKEAGAVWGGTLIDCTLTNNVATANGGATGGSWVIDSQVLNNTAGIDGGGAYGGRLINCTVTGNTATANGGATKDCRVINSLLLDNTAGIDGGGAYGGQLINCTVTENTAMGSGGGAYGATLENSIVYFNEIDGSPSDPTANHDALSRGDYSCTTPLPGLGISNISAAPQFANPSGGDYQLLNLSPCINAGGSVFWLGPTDLAGHARVVDGTVDMGAFEYPEVAAPVTITVRATPGATSSSPMGGGDYFPGQEVVLSAGEIANAHWQFTAWNDGDTNPTRTITVPTSDTSYVATFTEQVGSLTTYVAANNPTPRWPHTSWETAATRIQDAIDAVLDGDTVIVSNGVYAAGGRVVAPSALTNRVAITQAITVESVNGPAVTIIEGAGPRGPTAVRGVYLGPNAQLYGFTVTGGATHSVGTAVVSSGGGIYCSDVTANVINCIIRNNAAIGGGGAYQGTLINCLITSNEADLAGGGVNRSELSQCTLAKNHANSGGGAAISTLNNCIVYFNTATTNPNQALSTLNFTCTTPLPGTGFGNIDDAPGFLNLATGDFHLFADSPAINAGENTYVTSAVDLDNTRRITANVVDMGPYESLSNFGLVGPEVAFAECNNFEDPGLTLLPLAPPKAIAAGGYHSLALRDDASVVTWGLPDPDTPVALTNVAAISASTFYNLALTTNGTVLGWGAGTSPVPVGLSNVVAVSAGTYHGLALSIDGAVTSWGGQVNMTPPTDLPFTTAIAAGSDHNLALGTNGMVTSWPVTVEHTPPPGLINVVAISAANHSLALKADGTVTAWGPALPASYDAGQNTVPPGLSNVTAIAAGALHNLALHQDGTVSAWGAGTYEDYSDIDNLVHVGQSIVPLGLTNVVAISAGTFHSLALQADGTVVAWGITNSPLFFNQTVVPPGIETRPVEYSYLVPPDPQRLDPQEIIYHVTDGAGKSGYIRRTFEVIDTTPPELYLMGTNEIAVNVGMVFVDPGAIAMDGCEGDLTADILTTNTVSTVTPEIFTLHYQVSDSFGNVARTQRIVRVEESLAIAAASERDQDSARLNGFVNPADPPAFAWFEWSSDLSYTNQTAQFAVNQGRALEEVWARLYDLQPGQEYHYRLVVTNASGVHFSADETFTTTVDEAVGYKLGNLAPELTAPDELNQMVSLSDYRGSYVLLDFCTGWCNPCALNAGEVFSVQHVLNKAGMPLQYLSVLFQGYNPVRPSSQELAQRWTTEFSLGQRPTLHANDDQTLFAMLSEQFNAYGDKRQSHFQTPNFNIPLIVLVDPDGVIVAKWEGYVEFGIWMERFGFPAELSAGVTKNSDHQRVEFAGQPNSEFYQVMSTTDLTLPASDWTVHGPPTEFWPGRYEFNYPESTNAPALFFRLRHVLPLVNPETVEVFPYVLSDPQSNGLGGSSGGITNEYEIGKYEITNAEYVAFLNAVDPNGINALALYNAIMGTSIHGGISFSSGATTGSKYTVKAGFASKPVNFVNLYDAMRFCNWLHFGAQSGGNTEDGAYTLQGGTALPANGLTIQRNPKALFALPTEDEWYRAAYNQDFVFSGDTDDFWLYPTKSNSPPNPESPPGTQLSANYSLSVGTLSDVGAYLSTTFWGAFDMAGNVTEWIETRSGSSRVLRGGSWDSGEDTLRSSHPLLRDPDSESNSIGFRISRP